MALTNAQRQARYRLKHSGSKAARINTFVHEDCGVYLKCLARHHNITQRELLETLLKQALDKYFGCQSYCVTISATERSLTSSPPWRTRFYGAPDKKNGTKGAVNISVGIIFRDVLVFPDHCPPRHRFPIPFGRSLFACPYAGHRPDWPLSISILGGVLVALPALCASSFKGGLTPV